MGRIENNYSDNVHTYIHTHIHFYCENNNASLFFCRQENSTLCSCFFDVFFSFFEFASFPTLFFFLPHQTPKHPQNTLPATIASQKNTLVLKKAMDENGNTIIKTKPRTGARRVLVTGGAGFVGSHLCDALVAVRENSFVFSSLLLHQNFSPSPRSNAVIKTINFRDAR